MTVEPEVSPPADNIRTLLHHLAQAIDARFMLFRKGTIYESIRPSDVRVFVTSAQKAQTISQIARALGITRQAAQNSVRRLMNLQIIALGVVRGNKRDKFVVITAKGELARKTAAHQVAKIEAEFAAVIGTGRVEQLRRDLVSVLESTRNQNSITQS